jgi:transposase
MKAVENQTSKPTSPADMQAEIDRLNKLVEKLKFELLHFRRALFGRSSERYVKEDPDQLALDFQGIETLPEEESLPKQEDVQTITYERKKQKQDAQKPVRQPLPEHLERREEIIEPDPIPQGSKCMGEEVTEILEYTPGTFYVRRIVRRKYALPAQEGIIIADLPSLPLPKSNAGASLLAHLLVSKYMDHLPFYRQIEIFKRGDIHLAASTINGWFSSAVDLLQMLYEELRQQVLASHYIQIDETSIPVVDKDKPGATKKGYHWIVRSPQEKMLFFHYDQGSRSQRVAIDILRNFKGAVQSDGYGAYNIYENKQDVLLLGCWAHARRKFEQALQNDPARAAYALEQIQQLYLIEREAENSNLTPEHTSEMRKQKAYPILKSFEKWLDKTSTEVLPKSQMGHAIAYTYNIYPRLVRYVIDGRYKIDNNGAENGIRPLALGRKNYLFCGNHEAARHTAIIYSLLGTCKLNNVNPTEWLTDVFNQIQDCKNTQLHTLLPGAWAANQQL